MGLSMACWVELTQLGPADGQWVAGFGTFDGLLGGIDPIGAGGWWALGLSMACWVELTQLGPVDDGFWDFRWLAGWN